jgi:hypothetical protein
MIQPATLMQNNEALDTHIAAPARLQAKQLRCGLEMNGFVCQPACLQRFATHRVFVAVLAALGFLQGAAMGYFTATAYAVANIFGFSRDLVGKRYDVSISYQCLSTGERRRRSYEYHTWLK